MKCGYGGLIVSEIVLCFVREVNVKNVCDSSCAANEHLY